MQLESNYRALTVLCAGLAMVGLVIRGRKFSEVEHAVTAPATTRIDNLCAGMDPKGSFNTRGHQTCLPIRRLSGASPR